jgi:hypothetical protein
MSLGDELRFQRAMAGGPTPMEIAEETGVDSGLYCQLEQRYREIGDGETIDKLAAYFKCDPATLKRAQSRSRKALSQYLYGARDSGHSVRLELRTQEILQGHVAWWDLGAVGLVLDDSDMLTVVQRHAVIDW